MGDISKYFNRKEFACKCGCGFNAVDVHLLEVLETVRVHFDSPVIINCACRCQSHNKAVGGAENSQHLHGIAADIAVKNVAPALVADYLESRFPTSGIGRYNTFTHIDVRGYAARWVNYG